VIRKNSTDSNYVVYFCNSCFVSTLFKCDRKCLFKIFFFLAVDCFPPLLICIANSSSARFRIVTGQTLSVEVHLLKRQKELNLIY